MSFFECEFPTAIAFGDAGGPAFSTQVNIGFSGYEQRNRNWAFALGKWQLDLNAKPQATFDQVYSFWLAVGGRADAFRFKDHKDYSGTGETCLAVESSDPSGYPQFQLQKLYTVGGRTYTRTIKKPITSSVAKFDGTACENTVKAYVDEVALDAEEFSVDHTTGLITIPGYTTGAVTADFEFHFPVRFDTDECNAVIETKNPAGNVITWPGIQLVEVRL